MPPVLPNDEPLGWAAVVAGVAEENLAVTVGAAAAASMSSINTVISVAASAIAILPERMCSLVFKTLPANATISSGENVPTCSQYLPPLH
jgi:hypothetical protein